MNRSVLLMANVAYFAVAAAAGIFITSEAWHYGFFFRPFPAIFTAVSLLFVGASVIGTLFAIRGILQCATLVLMFCLWASAAISGSYLSSSDAVATMLCCFIAIVLGVSGAVFACGRQAPSISSFSPGALGRIRAAALLLPLPMFLYCGWSAYMHTFASSVVAQVSAPVFLNCQEVLFGAKRACSDARILCMAEHNRR